MTIRNRAYLELHIAVLLFGFTAILGDLITLPAVTLVWWRVLLAAISLLFFIKLGKTVQKISKSKILKLMGVGVLVAIHWIAFYGSIKMANASIALICLATTSFFTSMLEPMICKVPFSWRDLFLGLLIIPAMAFIVSDLQGGMIAGVGVGLISALFASLFGCYNKKYIDDSDALTITFLELGSAWIFLSAILLIYLVMDVEIMFWPTNLDWVYMAILVLLCTTLAYVLALRSLKYLSAFTSNLTINLEPVYGIILAIVLLNENRELNPSFYIGAVLITAIVFFHPFIDKSISHAG